MSIIISDEIYYFHKGFLNDEWKQVKFELYRNGHLARLNTDGSTEKTIDLKKCYNSIKVKPALDFVICKHHSANEKKSPLNFSVDKDSKLMVIPNRTGNKWILLFLKSENLNEWMKHIKKWGCVPKIKIEVYNESEEDNTTNTIDFFHEMKSTEHAHTKEQKICKKFSFKNNVFGLISNHNTGSNNGNYSSNHTSQSFQSDSTSASDKNEKRKIRPIFNFGNDSKFQMLDVNS